MLIRTNLNSVISSDALLPSVLETTNAETVSARYKHIQTSDVIDVLQIHGYNVSSQTGNRGNVHSKHALTLVNRSLGFRDASGSDNFATVTMFNGHDGKSALQLITGFLRQICTNGMVAGSADDIIRVRHSQSGYDNLAHFVAQLPEKLRAFTERVEKLQNRLLTPDEKQLLAAAIFERIRESRKIPNADTLLSVRRSEDTRSDAWTVINTIQENAVKGGFLTDTGRRLRPAVSLVARTQLTREIMNTAETVLIAG